MRRALALMAWSICAVFSAENGISVEATVPWSDHLQPTPVVVTIDSDRPRTLRIDVSGQSNHALVVWSVPPGITRRTALLPPDPGHTTYSVNLHWQDGSLSDNVSAHSGHRPRGVMAVDDAGSTELSKALGERHSEQQNWYSYNTTSGDTLPDCWQGYGGALTLILDPASQRRLTPEQHAAISTWLDFGGRLVLLDPAQRTAWPGNASILVSPRDQLPKTLIPWLEHQQWAGDTGTLTPIPGTESPPTRLLVGLVVLFAVIAGPLVIWWCWRRGQRTRLFLIAPAVSAGFVLILVVANLFAEGTALRRMADQLVVLDQRTHRALVWTGCTWFAPFGLGRLTLDPQQRAVITVREERNEWEMQRNGDDISGLGYDWSAGLELTGPWVAPRINRRLLLSGPVAERGRLTISRSSGGGYHLHNGLSSAITWATWTQPDGRTLTVRAVQPGATGPLTADPAANGQPADDLGVAARRAWTSTSGPGAFRAQLAQPLYPIPGTAAVDVRPTATWLVTTLGVEGRP